MNKKCTKCGRSKSILEFALDRSRKDGFQCWCRDCKAERPYKRHRSPPPRSLRRGRSRAAKRRKHVSRTSGGQVILSLLKNTLWPQSVIAQLANVHRNSVHRIAKRHGLTNRYRVSRTSLHTLKDHHLSKRLWYGLIDAYNRQNRVLPQKVIQRVLLATKKGADRHAAARRKLRLQRLKGVKSRRRIPAATKKNEGLSPQELALLALMLQGVGPATEPRKEPGRRVVSHSGVDKCSSVEYTEEDKDEPNT